MREDARGNLLLCFAQHSESVIEATKYMLSSLKESEYLFLLQEPERLAKKRALAEVGAEDDPRSEAIFEEEKTQLKGQALLLQSLR